MALYERELAWYRADAPFLTVEKSAQRCGRLSFLLTAAVYGNNAGDTTSSPVLS
jgi:hypothetical protein